MSEPEDFSPHAKFWIRRRIHVRAGLTPEIRYGGKVYMVLGGFDPDVFGWDVDVVCNRHREALYIEAEKIKFHIGEVTV